VNDKTLQLLDRTFAFCVNTLKFLNSLPDDHIYRSVKLQIAKSSGSVGANYEEAQGASSKKDFNNKISISYREARESLYWFRVLKELYPDDIYKESFEKHIQEANELKKIFASIKLSSKG